MKIIQLTFSIILALTLSGCAYNGYQHGHNGYSRSYGPAYSTGYVVQKTYDYYPGQSYYPPGGFVEYRQRYVSPSYPNRAARHGGKGHYDQDGGHGHHGHGHQQSDMRNKHAGKGKGRHFGNRNTAVANSSWQSTPTSTQIPPSSKAGKARRNFGNRSNARKNHHSHGQH